MYTIAKRKDDGSEQITIFYDNPDEMELLAMNFVMFKGTSNNFLISCEVYDVERGQMNHSVRFPINKKTNEQLYDIFDFLYLHLPMDGRNREIRSDANHWDAANKLILKKYDYSDHAMLLSFENRKKDESNTVWMLNSHENNMIDLSIISQFFNMLSSQAREDYEECWIDFQSKFNTGGYVRKKAVNQ